MQTIYHLSEHIVSKISAGEVIERPAYAVKELIDNAIDAKATVIQISIEEAGLKRISVQDNGSGMSSEDVALSFLQHTTSKLKDEHELLGIKTLGFRGEALASIAAISTLTIKTRLASQPGGTEAIIRYGNKERVGPVGTPPGTIITIDNLFLNVPARKKFLKSTQTEFRLISEIVMHFALSYPNIHFVLLNNKKLVFDLAGKNDRSERVKFLLGKSLVEHLLPITFEESYLKISGFIGKPQIASRQNQHQYIFVNDRHITDKKIALALKESFGTLLPAASTPVFILFISLPPETIDVNVHPRKEQIAFMNATEIFSIVKQATTQLLNDHNITFTLAKFRDTNSAKTGETTSFSGQVLKDVVLPWNRSTPINFKITNQLIQVHQTYIFSQIKEGIVLIDQHAAHERILYEQFVTAFEKQKNIKENYELPKPLSLSLSVIESQIMEEYSSYFLSMGFGIEHFQGTRYVLRSVPIVFKGRNIEKIIRDIFADLENDKVKSLDDRSQRMLAFLSCRAAVKAGDLLTEKQMKALSKQLSETKNKTTCPHGRPTTIQITIHELHKLFKRKS